MTKREECIACAEKRRRGINSVKKRSSSAKPRLTIYSSPKTPSASVPALNMYHAKRRSSSAVPHRVRPHFAEDTIASAVRRREPYHSNTALDSNQGTPQKRPSMLERKIIQQRDYLKAHNVDIAKEHVQFSYNDACARTSRSGLTLHQLKCDADAHAHNYHHDNSDLTDVNAILDNALQCQVHAQPNMEDDISCLVGSSRRYSESDVRSAKVRHNNDCHGSPLSSRDSLGSDRIAAQHHGLDNSNSFGDEPDFARYARGDKLRNLGLAGENEATPIPSKQAPFGHGYCGSPEMNANFASDLEATPKAAQKTHQKFLVDPEATPMASDFTQLDFSDSEQSSKENECVSVIENGATPVKKPELNKNGSAGRVLGVRPIRKLEYGESVQAVNDGKKLNDSTTAIKQVNMPPERMPVHDEDVESGGSSPSPTYTIDDFTLEKCREVVDMCTRSRKFLRDVRKTILVARRDNAKTSGDRLSADRILMEMKEDVTDCRRSIELLQKKFETLCAADSSNVERAVFYVDRIIDLSGWQLSTINLIESVERGALSPSRLHEELSKLLYLVNEIRNENEEKRVVLTTPKRQPKQVSLRSGSKSFTEKHSLMLEDRIASIGVHIIPEEKPIEVEESLPQSPTDSRAKDTDYDVSSLQDLEVSVRDSVTGEEHLESSSESVDEAPTLNFEEEIKFSKIDAILNEIESPAAGHLTLEGRHIRSLSSLVDEDESKLDTIAESSKTEMPPESLEDSNHESDHVVEDGEEQLASSIEEPNCEVGQGDLMSAVSEEEYARTSTTEETDSKSKTESTSKSDSTTESSAKSKSEPTDSSKSKGDKEEDVADEPSISEMDDVKTAVDSSSANLDSIWQSEGVDSFNLTQANLDNSIGLNSSLRRRTYINGSTLSLVRNSLSPKTQTPPLRERANAHWRAAAKGENQAKPTEFTDSLTFDLSCELNDVAVPDSVIPGLDFDSDLSKHDDETFSVMGSFSVQGQLDAACGRLRKELPSTVEEMRPELTKIAERLLPYVTGEAKEPLTYQERSDKIERDLQDQLKNSYEALVDDLCVDVVKKLNLPGDLRYSVPLTHFARKAPSTVNELITLFEAQLQGKLSTLDTFPDASNRETRGDRVYIEKEPGRPKTERVVLDVLMPDYYGAFERGLHEEMTIVEWDDAALLTNTTTSSF
uniref:Kinesin motor domain-containing protein n=1 Tax=Steinernema glaseri TaxID=37863 RepID=A0A1I8A3Z9_9BILA